MKNLNKLQELTFELEEIESIEDIGYKDCTDIQIESDASFTLMNGIIVHNSAAAGLSDGLGRKDIGYFATRGVPLNTYEVKPQKIVDNEELANIIKILGLKLGESKQDMTYDKVILASDQDCCEEHTLVLTKRGNIPLNEIIYGDEVLTHTGKWQKVINIIEKVKQDCVQICLNNQYFYFSKNHKLPVIRNNKLQYICAKDILLTDLFLMKKDK